MPAEAVAQNVGPAQRDDSLVVHCLRGVAAYMVVIFHARVDLWQGWRVVSTREDLGAFERLMAYFSLPAAFGAAGVILFFILSGYCIALPHAGPTGRPLVFKEYLARRFFRIYPPYAAVLLLCGLVTWWGVSRGVSSLADTAGYWTSLFMVQNYTTGQIALNPSLWSLPVEMELYLVFPLFYLGLRRLGPRGTWAGAVMLSLVGIGLHKAGWAGASANFAIYWLIWWGGAMLAEWRKSQTLRAPGLLILLGAAGAFAVGALGTLKTWDPVWLHFGYGFGFFVALWFMLAHEEIITRSLRCIAPLVVGAGTISYSLYLVHFPVLRVMGALWVERFGEKPLNFIWVFAALVPVTLVAWVFYKVAEEPSHRWAKRWSRRAS